MPILSLPRLAKRLVVLIVDSSLCVLAVWFAYYLRFGEFVPLSGDLLITISISLIIAIPIFIFFGLYRAIFRYSGWPALVTVSKACVVYGLLYSTVFTAYGFPGIPRTIGIIQPILLLLMIGSSRAFASYWLGDSYREQLRLGAVPRVLIYGAGSTGRQLAAALRNSHQMKVMGYLDDDSTLWGQSLNNLIIYNPMQLHNIVKSFAISDILLALPSINRQRRNEILSTIAISKVSVRTLPSVTDLASGKVTASDLRELDIEDLLGRNPIVPDSRLLQQDVYEKVVLVTGAGGSIGSELCRQILNQQPSKLILIEQSEFALYTIEQELLKLISKVPQLDQAMPKVLALLGSVQNHSLMQHIILEHAPHVIFHAAAYKHVPLVEANFTEAIMNNVFGTLTLAKLASQLSVPKFILISTDKAVRPTNIMGASKRLAEMVLQAFSDEKYRISNTVNTVFSMVRFGNVLDSSGSVVPLFRRQIAEGGPITLTHPEVTRFFMTIPEAAQLVIQAGAMAKGGDVFVLDMGEPVKIADLAKLMIKLSGLEVRDTDNPKGDIEIQIIGLRPGEKLFEELLIGDNPELTRHSGILMAHEDFLPISELEQLLEELKDSLKRNSIIEVQKSLKNIVRDYQPNS